MTQAPSTGIAPDALTLRPADPADRAFLLDLYAETRADELAAAGWTAAQREAFVAMQFSVQDRYYREQCPDASYDVVLLHGRPVGRLYVSRRPAAIRIMEISLLPEVRNRGLGSALLRRLMAEAIRTHSELSLHVAADNPALRLYVRLGFVPGGQHGPDQFMTWSAP